MSVRAFTYQSQIFKVRHSLYKITYRIVNWQHRNRWYTIRHQLGWFLVPFPFSYCQILKIFNFDPENLTFLTFTLIKNCKVIRDKSMVQMRHYSSIFELNFEKLSCWITAIIPSSREWLGGQFLKSINRFHYPSRPFITLSPSDELTLISQFSIYDLMSNSLQHYCRLSSVLRTE